MSIPPRFIFETVRETYVVHANVDSISSSLKRVISLVSHQYLRELFSIKVSLQTGRLQSVSSIGVSEAKH